MQQEQVILHQIAAERGLRQVAAREAQHEFVPRVGLPPAARGGDAGGRKRSPRHRLATARNLVIPAQARESRVNQRLRNAALDPRFRGGDEYSANGSLHRIGHQPSSRLRVLDGSLTTSPSSSSVMMIWQPRREVAVRPKARSSMSSSSSLASFKQLVPFRIDDDVTGRAGERALAGALDVDLVLVRDFEHRQTERRLDLAARPVALDECHFRHEKNPPKLHRDCFGASRLAMTICRMASAVIATRGEAILA